jgi:DNA-binding transcriptional MerR regulator
MQKTVQQIPLNFGEEPEVPSPAAKEDNGVGDQHERQYMAAAGVVVRVKSYKNPRPAVAVNAELFSADAAPPAEALPEEPEIPAAEAAQPEPAPGPVIEAEAEEPLAVPSAAGGLPQAMPAPTPVPAAVPEQTVTVAPPRKEQRRTKTGKTAAPKATPAKRGRKSLKQITAEADLIDIPADEVLFSKQYYTMGEVSEMFRVNQSLLRFWETEFDILQPKKNKKGDRYFRPVDIKNLHLIYHLLRQKKYTIEGAKDFLRKNKKADQRFEVIQHLQKIKSFLLEWKAQL